MSEALPKSRLYAALVKAQCDTHALYKDAKNEHHKYAYASAESVIDEARKALGGAGLALLQAETSYAALEKRINVGKSQELVGRTTATYRLVHTSGESEDYTASLPVVVSSGRPDDKAEAAVLTMLLAYFLRGLLLIPRDDGAASVDARDDRDSEPGERREPEAKRAEEPRYDDRAPTGREVVDGCPIAGFDPANVGLAREFVRRAKQAKLVREVADLAAETKAAKLPTPLEDWTLSELRAEKEAILREAA